MIVDVIGEALVELVISNRYVHAHSLLYIHNVLLQTINFNFSVFQLFEKLETYLVALVDFFLHFQNILRPFIKFLLNLFPLNFTISVIQCNYFQLFL